MTERSTTQTDAGPAGDPTRIETPLGSFHALRDGDVVRVRNIRYARADRFAAPSPVAPDPAESAPLQHVRYACPQPPSPADQVYGPQLRDVEPTEDCLRLSITRPAETDGALPVLVWVHGGAYVSGAGDLAGYDPTVLVREHGVLVVNVTYRLGALGFFSDGGSDDVAAAVEAGRPANLGLLDLLAALRWVRDHVHAFGGDPDQVTLVGQSAGADAIAHLLGADDADGLFSRAILQSPPLGVRGGRAEVHAGLVEAAGPLDPTGTVDDVLAAQQRAMAAVAGMNDRAGMPFAPEYGRAPLPSEEEFLATWRRRAPGLELMVTWTSQEGETFVQLDPRGRALRDKPVVGRLLAWFVCRKVTDTLFRTGCKAFAKDMADAGAAVVAAELTTRPVDAPMGATHAVELGLLFPNPDRWAEAPVIGPAGARTLVEAGRDLRAAWAEFARTGRLAADRVGTGPGWTGELRVTRRS
ncbi:carboxylesterase family protein [Isoptericola chiayiensis]|uniref:Carboxylic ester hydrolase n=1 Tax=Isoptericola chiayiensis TaxID=579446 RepID=A0ABP8YW84_9MICO|nr:carboxylesterase family protein [Isoptericola chiayiensis]NOW02349.1 para-nitrobenzyl esterase [Isoptericola chiayiensis]